MDPEPDEAVGYLKVIVGLEVGEAAEFPVVGEAVVVEGGGFGGGGGAVVGHCGGFDDGVGSLREMLG